MTDYAAYLDDSGHPTDQPYVVVAGFLASEADWLSFLPEWGAALTKYGIGPIFHMTEFRGAIPKAKQNKMLEELTRIIANRVSHGFSVAVDMKAYREINDLYPLEESVGTPFAIAARTVARGINEWKSGNLRPGDRLQVFIEAGTKHMGDMEEAFRRDELPLPQRVQKNNPAVQPADLLAWETLRFARRGDKRRSLANLVRKVHLFEGMMRREELLHAVRSAGVAPRASLPANVQMSYHSTPKRLRRRTIE